MFADDRQATEYFAVAADDPLFRTDDFMRQWAERQIGYNPVMGYAPHCSTCREAVSSRQWESEDEVIDERQKSFVVAAVTGAMDSLDDPLERAVLWQVYANSVGPAVWKNGRLSALGRGGVLKLHRRALQNMQRLLRRRGLVV